MSTVGGSWCVVEGGAAGKIIHRAAMLRLYRPTGNASGSPVAVRAGQSGGASKRLARAGIHAGRFGERVVRRLAIRPGRRSRACTALLQSVYNPCGGGAKRGVQRTENLPAPAG